MTSAEIFKTDAILDDSPDKILSFNGPGDRRSLDGFSGHIDEDFEAELRKLAAAKTEDNVEDILGGSDVCGAEGCRHIGIAPDS